MTRLLSILALLLWPFSAVAIFVWHWPKVVWFTRWWGALCVVFLLVGCKTSQPSTAATKAMSTVSAVRTIAAVPPLAQTYAVTLAWDPVTNANVAGYNIYDGPASGRYTNVLSVGNVTNANVANLQFGVWYYLAVTTLSTSGQESAYSQELWYVPLPPNVDVYYPQTRVFAVKPFNLSLTNPPGTAFYRAALTRTNGSQYTFTLQSAGAFSGWTNTALTITTNSKSLALALLNTTNWIVGTNYFTNLVALSGAAKLPPNPVMQ